VAPGQVQHTLVAAAQKDQRALRRRGRHPQLGKLVVAPSQAHRLARPERADDRQRLFQSRNARPRRVERQAHRLVLGAQPARPKPKLQAPAGERGERRGLLGEQRGVAEVVGEHHGAQVDALGGASCGGEGHQRRVLLAKIVGHQVVADQECVVAELLDAADMGEPCAWR